MKIRAGGMHRAVRAGAVAAVDPCAVAFTTEQIGFGQRFRPLALMFLFV